MYSKLSIVIPIYNELENVKNIVRQLDSIGKDNFEVIFVDGYRQSDSDLLRDIIGPKYKYIRSGKGRGRQMNKGFEMAKHDLILFLHCDSSIELRMVDDIISSANRGVYDLVQIDTRIVTSSRRFYTGKGRFNKPPLTDIGILMVMRDMQVFQRAYRRGIDPDIIVKRYYKH